MRRVKAMLLGDIKSITRDLILFVSIFAPILIALVLKFLLPLVADLLMEKLSFDLTQHYSIILGVMLLLVPFMQGMMSGFMILDERDEGILTYYSVTPLSKSGYFIYRLTSPLIACLIMSYFLVRFTGLADIQFTKLIPIILMVSIEAPITALFLGTFAANKVEGLALSKALGVLFIAPVAGYLIKSNWQLLAGIAPTYWGPKAFIAAVEGNPLYWAYIAVGLVVHAAIAYLMFKKFEVKAL